MIDLPLTPLADALAYARETLPSVVNLGRTGDERDLYDVIERLTEGVQATRPESKCGAGCSGCCALHKAIFRIFRSEWDVVHDHLLEAWDPTRLARFIDRFWEVTGPYLPLLDDIQARMDQGERVKPDVADLPVDCAFLEDGLCGVYPARAAICRGFGYFQLRPDDGRPLEIYACNMQREALAPEAGEPRPKLPVFNTLYSRVEDLCDGDRKLLIPLWIARTFPRLPQAGSGNMGISKDV